LRSGKSNTNANADCYFVTVPVLYTYTNANPLLRQVYTDTAASA
jgi:hypothetical protein